MQPPLSCNHHTLLPTHTDGSSVDHRDSFAARPQLVHRYGIQSHCSIRNTSNTCCASLFVDRPSTTHLVRTPSSTAERQLLSKANKCVCGPHVDDRTPAEICATQYTRKGVTYYCNAGGYFPVLEGGCNKFFTCDAAGNAFEIACPDGTCEVGSRSYSSPPSW